MLAVLAIIGVLSIAALVGFTYAMNKHRANETIYDVMLRGTNVPMIDEYYYDKASGYEFRFPGLVNNGRQGTYYPMTTKKDAGSSYYVEATGVTYRVCEMILKMNPTDIDQIVVGNTVYQGDSDICGMTDGLAMKFCFGSDGTICDGTGHGGSSGGSGSGDSSGGTSGGSGSGSEPDPEPDPDPCSLSKDCTGSMVCINGLCQDPNPNEPCSTDADCLGDQTCTNSICEKPETCTTSADCDGNLTCTEDGECKNPEPCSTDTDCPEEHICIEGTCRAPECTDGTVCGDNGCCKDGFCSSNCTCEERGGETIYYLTGTCCEQPSSCCSLDEGCVQEECTITDSTQCGVFCTEGAQTTSVCCTAVSMDGDDPKAVTPIRNMNVRTIQILGVVKSVNLAEPRKVNVMRVMRLRQKTMRLFAKIADGIGSIPLLCTTARRILHVAGLNGVRPDMAAVGIPILRLQSREMSRGHIVVKKVRRPMLLTVQGSTPFNAARQIAFSCVLQ